jgi:Rrf2 family protein
MKAGELAAELDASKGFLAHALTPLVNRGWVRSEPGPTGGYSLAVELHGISVLEVVEAIEGTTDLGRCVLEDRACAGGGQCALHEPWARARGHLLVELSSTPLSAVAERAGRAAATS